MKKKELMSLNNCVSIYFEFPQFCCVLIAINSLKFGKAHRLTPKYIRNTTKCRHKHRDSFCFSFSLWCVVNDSDQTLWIFLMCSYFAIPQLCFGCDGITFLAENEKKSLHFWPKMKAKP